MNKKGFTLVELLAVIVILALLALLTSTAVTKLVKDAKDDLSETQMTLIKSAADTWIADNLNNLPSSGSCSYLTLEDLKYYGLLDNVILDPKNSEEIPNDLKIKITTTTSAYGNPVTNAEVNPESIEGCSQIYFPICTLTVDSTVTGLNAGAKYNCKVDSNKDPYIFYVLTTASSNDTTVNMIMDSNINISGEAVKEGVTDLGLVEWITQRDYEREDIGGTNWNDYKNNNAFGPITAIEYLKKATSGWSNVNPQTINTFTDDCGALHDIAKTYIVNARLPYLNEISLIGCSITGNSVQGSCSNWLVDYLNDSGYQTTAVAGVNGYWIFSSNATDSNSAWRLDPYGYADTLYGVIDIGGWNGVRPVINVPVNRIIQTNQ